MDKILNKTLLNLHKYQNNACFKSQLTFCVIPKQQILNPSQTAKLTNCQNMMNDA